MQTAEADNALAVFVFQHLMMGEARRAQFPLGAGGCRRRLLLLRLVTSVANSTAAAGYLPEVQEIT